LTLLKEADTAAPAIDIGTQGSELRTVR